MSSDSHAIKTTHVGSLIRPDDVVAVMRRIAKGEAVDAAEHQQLLERAVRDVVRRQKEAGVDIVSDGEYGKIGWNFYVYERLAGIELRPPANDTFGDLPIRATDWERFPEFYAEYFKAEQDFEAPAGEFAARRRDHLHGAGRDRSRHRQPQGGDGGRGRRGGLPARRRAGELLPEPDRRALRLRGGRADGRRRGAARGVPGDRRRGAQRAGRRRVHPVHVRRPGAARDDGRLPRLGPAAHRRGEPRARGHPRGSGPLPRLLGQLERPAHQRHRPARHPAARPPGQRAARTCSSTPTRATSTSGACGRTSSCRTASCSRPASSATRPTSSSTPSSSPSASSASRGSSAPSASIASTDCGFAQGPFLRRVHPTIQWAKLEALAEGAAIASRNLALVG